MTRARAMIARARLLRLFHVLLSVLSSRANDDVRLRGQGLPTYEHGQPPPKAGHVRFDVVFQANSSLAYNHMAMIEWLPARSRIVAAWQAARLSEGSKSQVLLISYSDDFGAMWSSPHKLDIHKGGTPGVLWSPVLHRVQGTDELMLFYSRSTACLRAAKVVDGKTLGEPRWNPGGDIEVVTSLDGGETWGLPRAIYQQADEGGIPKVIANRIHLLRRTGLPDRMLLPFWRERARGATPTARCPTLIGQQHESSGVLITDDSGKTWRASGHIADPAGSTWLIEGTLAEIGNGTLIMLLRSASNAVWSAKSSDGGESWSSPSPLSLANPNSKVSAVSLAFWDGVLVAALNHHPRLHGNHSRTRSQLVLVSSLDGGEVWQIAARLEDAMTPGNWFHYPTILEVSKSAVLVAYSVQHSSTRADGIWLATVSLTGSAFEHPLGDEQVKESSAPLKLQVKGFSASSTHGHCRAGWAAMDGPKAWCAASLDGYQWLQVDLPGIANITHIATAGRPDSTSDQRVTAYSLSFSRNGWHWENYRGTMVEFPGVEEVVLAGNTLRGKPRANQVVGRDGYLGVAASSVRVHPVRWIGHISMQVALFTGATPPKSAQDISHDEL